MQRSKRVVDDGSPHGNDKVIRETSAMIFRYCINSFRFAVLLFVAVVEASGQKAPSAKPFERFDGCVLTPDQWTDGDSFRVRLPDGRSETFRLNFVDTTESRSRGKRSDEQAAYFGLTRAQAIELGRLARGKSKRYSPAEIKKRTKRLAEARKKRWAKRR